MRLTTEARITAQGQAVARSADGQVVFVEGAAPRETVQVEVLERKKRFARARVLRVLESGPDRVQPPCPHYGTCGGCSLQHVRDDAQAGLKARAARDTLSRIGGLEPEHTEPTWSGPGYGTRSRARWLVIRTGSGAALGYRARRSHRGVPIETCPVLEPKLQEALPIVQAHLPKDAHEVWAVTDSEAVAVSTTPTPPGLAEGPLAVRDAAGVRWVSAQSFSQNHRAGNDALIETLRRWLTDGARALELYSGSGNFTRVLESRVSDQVVAVESDRSAVRLARKIRSSKTQLVQRPVEQVRLTGDWDVVLVDPPRTGLPETVSDRLAQAPGVLVYVSCDPATFARDAKRLTKAGRRLGRFRAFDLYPQTGHLELAAEFLPAEARS